MRGGRTINNSINDYSNIIIDHFMGMSEVNAFLVTDFFGLFLLVEAVCSLESEKRVNL